MEANPIPPPGREALQAHLNEDTSYLVELVRENDGSLAMSKVISDFRMRPGCNTEHAHIAFSRASYRGHIILMNGQVRLIQAISESDML